MVKDAFPPVVTIEDPFTDVVLDVLSVSKGRVENSKEAMQAALYDLSKAQKALLGRLAESLESLFS